MSIAQWIKALVERQSADEPATNSGLGLSPELRSTRLLRTVRDFPGRTEASLARIIYGQAGTGLVSEEARLLEAAGFLTRSGESGQLYATSARI